VIAQRCVAQFGCSGYIRRISVRGCHHDNQWADGYVLPDIVPISTDSDEVVEYKVRETLYHCSRFFDQMPSYVQKRALTPVHGRTPDQINRCIEPEETHLDWRFYLGKVPLAVRRGDQSYQTYSN
jgi:hypothetical protein